VFVRKMEFRSPFERACDRAWFKVYVVLDGTMLKICRVRMTALAERASAHEVAANPDLPIAATAGMVLKTYTLQHAEVGNAVDYTKFVCPFPSTVMALLTGYAMEMYLLTMHSIGDLTLFVYVSRLTSFCSLVIRLRRSSIGWKL
jgi:hypothetical protein